METKKFTLPDMIVNRYSRDRNTVIKWKNKSQGGDNIPMIDTVELLATIDSLSEEDITILKQELNQCWSAFFDEAECRVYPELDRILNVKLD